ncbi:hypothetical protein [Methylotuvimicrobium sp. KM1]|uniref:hypothetical protein n=1 Tax=Methylotuvimicrobium sp. KM1 TaxID=3377707 RepID=UPI00384F7E62
MSAQLFSSQERVSDDRLKVSFRFILGFYAIIPICLLVEWFDILLWQGSLREMLPSRPEHFLLFQLLFGTPHIIASALILTANREYFGYYRHRIMMMTLVLAVFFGIGGLFIPYRVFYIMVAAWTVYHVLKQQHGIARGVCKLPTWPYRLMLGLSVAAGLLIYLGIFLKNSLEPEQADWLSHIAGTLTLALLLATIWCQRYVTTGLGKLFLWANTMLVVSTYYLFVQQYYFLAILAPRLVHDATAYSFYVTHDYNRHGRQARNFIYRWAQVCNIPVLLVLPLLSFGAALLLHQYGDAAVEFLTEFLFGVEIRKAVSLGVIGYLALLHYYTEAFTWKNDSPYRKFIAFSK